MTATEKTGDAAQKKVEKAAAQFSQDRYLTRMLKGMALPLLYTIVSVLMLRKYSLEYPSYYDYEVLFIALGVGLGFLAITGLTLYNVLRAKKNAKQGVRLETKMIIAVYLPIMFIVLVIALFFGLSQAWQFSIGFFATTLLPPLIVLITEVTSKGHFFVREYERPSKMRYLLLVSNAAG
ncbi:MAG: hypothetical protein MUC62_06250 [Candidatus Thermoplasmatota archaeon]|jgi:hypothetical protein|nr:hypothetical protein [Candidatus Thermoplasmatota archaeon]